MFRSLGSSIGTLAVVIISMGAACAAGAAPTAAADAAAPEHGDMLGVPTDDRELIRIVRVDGATSTVALSFDADPAEKQSLSLGGETYEWTGFFKRFD